jgi:hypothetical protein
VVAAMDNSSDEDSNDANFHEPTGRWRRCKQDNEHIEPLVNRRGYQPDEHVSGFKCVNVMTKRIIGRVISKAQKRYRMTALRHFNQGKTTECPTNKRNITVPINSVGYSCINVMMQKVISKVKTRARDRQRAKAWNQSHPDHKRKPPSAESLSKRNKTTINARRRERQRTDPQFAAVNRIRTRLSMALLHIGSKRKHNTMKMVGCDATKLHAHLQGQFEGAIDLKLVDVDHIFPIASFDLSCHWQQECATHFTNLQPLLKSENKHKSDKLPTKAMASKVDRDKWPPGITEDMLPDIYPGWSTPLRM